MSIKFTKRSSQCNALVITKYNKNNNKSKMFIKLYIRSQQIKNNINNKVKQENVANLKH